LLVSAAAVPVGASVEDDAIQGVLHFGDFGQVNFFDPANGSIPSPPNSSGIQPAAVVSEDDAGNGYVEFTYNDGYWIIDVDVDAATVEITQRPFGSPQRANNWDIYLTGLDWSGETSGIAEVYAISDGFLDGLALELVDDSSLHFSFAGSSEYQDAGWKATFALVPEPSTLVMLLALAATGAAVGWRQRKLEK